MLIDTKETYVVIEWDEYYPGVNNIAYYGKKMDCERYVDLAKYSAVPPEKTSILTLQEYLEGSY